jgi:hypothetical protein
MKKLLLIIIASLFANVGFSDDMPSEVKRLKTLRDKKVEEIDKTYFKELNKLKKKYGANGNYKGIVYIEQMQATMASSTNEKEEKDKSKSLSELEKTAQRIVLPKLAFREADISNAIAYIRMTSKKVDPDGVGINILYLTTNSQGKAKKVTVNHEKITIYDALNDIAGIADLDVEYRENSVVLKHPSKK